MKKLVILLSIIIAPFLAKAQFSGYYGKKTYVEANFNAYMPLVLGLYDQNKGYKDGFYTRDWINYGFKGSIYRMVSSNVAIGLEVGNDYGDVGFAGYGNYIGYYSLNMSNYSAFNNYNNNYYGDIEIKHDMATISTFTIMPKVEFNTRGTLLPVGVSHQIGFGVTNSKVLERDYRFTVYYYGPSPSAEEQAEINNIVDNEFFDYDYRYRGFTLMYAFNMKTPITRSLLINYGLRYTFNSLFKVGGVKDKNRSLYQADALASNIQHLRISNIITLNIGLTYAF